MSSKEHWENVYTTKPADSVSWFQQHADTSLQFIDRSEIPHGGHIIDVGGGASTLVDDLLARGYYNVSVLDLSLAALQVAQSRLGKQAAGVTWLPAISLARNSRRTIMTCGMIAPYSIFSSMQKIELHTKMRWPAR